MKAKYFALLAIAFLLLSSCMKESTKTLYARQETNIETLVAAQQKANENYTVTTRDGSTRLTLAVGEGDELTDDKIISFYYAGYVLSGSSLPAASALFATNSEEVATAAKWDLTKADETGADVSGDASADASEDAAAEEVVEEPDPRYEILTVRLSEARFIEGLHNGLLGVKGGEECWIFFSGQHGFGDRKIGMIPANSAIAYHIWVHSVQTDAL